MNDAEFFSSTPQLQIIEQWARARYAAPRAVFGQVLARVIATTEPPVQLPGVIGGRASLNMIVVFVAPSGGGKGISDKVARLAWPAEILERPIGSGEGIAQTFKPPKDEDTKGITRALISVSEIDTIAGTASRQGSTLLATLKAAAMGELLGQANASEATTRIIQAHSYRVCLSIGAQPTHCGVLLDDTSGGTPQRVLWFPTTDPDMPADRVPDPEPLDVALPTWTRDGNGVVEIVYGPPEIEQAVIAAHLARQRGESDALDGHAMLTRLKVAAGLAIMHHRTVVSDLDWELSGAVMDMSNQTREWVLNESRKADREKIRGRAMARAAGEEFISDRRLERAMRSVTRWLEKADGNELPANILRSKLKADLRDHLGAALAELADRGTVIEISVDRGHRYRLNQESTGCTEVQGPSVQVTEGVPVVQGVPPAPGAATSESASETATDQAIEVNTSVSPLRNRDHKLSCSSWLDSYLAQRLAEGTETVYADAVNSAAEAYGFTASNVASNATSHPRIVDRRRDGKRTAWFLTAAAAASSTAPASTGRTFGGDYLERVAPDGRDVPVAEIRAAAEAAGHRWDACRKPDARVSVNAAGARTTWRLDPNYAQESA